MADQEAADREERSPLVSWETAPGLSETLAPLLRDMGSPLGGPDKKVRRRDPEGAAIYTVKTNRPGLPGELFVKVYRRPGIRWLVGRSAAGREWKMALAYDRLGLPIASHLARGVRRRRGWVVEEYLVQESLTGYEPFEEFFRTTFRPELPGASPQDKRKMISELAGLIRRMHDRGISRPELEPANIMAAPRSGGGVKFVFVDLNRSRLAHSSSGLDPHERVIELARFHVNFSRLFSQGYRIRFYREYFKGDKMDRIEFRALVKTIVDLAQGLARRREREVIRSIEDRKSPHFWFEAKDHRVYLRKPLYQNSLLELLDRLAAAENQSRVRIKQVRGLPPLELVLVKCRTGAAPPAASAARWAYYVSALMDYHGVSHFRVMAAVESRTGPDGLYLTVQPGKGENYLAEYLARRVAEEFSGLSWDRSFLIRIARFMLNLHEIGWYFPTPTEKDLWVRYTDEGTHEIRLFNLHRLRRLPATDGTTLLRNLFHLWGVLPISQADGVMLAEEYLRYSRQITGERTPWLRLFMEWQVGSVQPKGEV